MNSENYEKFGKFLLKVAGIILLLCVMLITIIPLPSTNGWVIWVIVACVVGAVGLSFFGVSDEKATEEYFEKKGGRESSPER